MSEAKSARINLRLNPESLETIKAAASVQQQDLTSFVLGAAMERARAVLTEDRLLRLTPHEVNQLERALDSEPEVVPQLRASSGESVRAARLFRADLGGYPAIQVFSTARCWGSATSGSAISGCQRFSHSTEIQPG